MWCVNLAFLLAGWLLAGCAMAQNSGGGAAKPSGQTPSNPSPSNKLDRDTHPATKGEAAQQADVILTGRFLRINDVNEIPRAMFGVHAMRLTPEKVADWGIESVRVIHHNPSGEPMIPGRSAQAPEGIHTIVECFYDRYQPALPLTDPNWQARLEKLARTYAENAKQTGITHHVEFWNEPFLNWATRPGVNYDPVFYESANPREGEPMTIKGWDKPLEHLVWSRQLRLVDPASGKVHYLANGDPPLQRANLKAGEMYHFRGKDYRMEEMWWGRDKNQRNYFSGPQNSQFYRWMLVPFAREMKKANPEVRIIAGWGFSIASHNWHAWETLFKPTIDDSIEWIDAIGEHHYGGEIRSVPATYETAYAYALAKYGKRLKFYNTEAGGLLDPQRPDTPARPQFSGNALEERAGMMTYMLRDILHTLATVPDKAVARASHASDNGADEFAFKLLKPLRGRLMEVNADDHTLFAVASQNGEDVVVAVFNDAATERSFKVDLRQTSKLGVRSIRRVVVRIDDDLRLEETELDRAVEIQEEKLPAKSAVVYRLLGAAPVNGQAWAGRQEVSASQHVAQDILLRIKPGETASTTIDLPPDSLEGATAARLRLVVHGRDPASSSILLNGRPLNVRPGDYIVDVPIDVRSLQLRNAMEFRSSPQSPRGYGIDSASIYLIR